MTVPKNVWWFEVLLYASLTLDALSVAFQDRTPRADMTEQMISVATIMAAILILLLVWFVWLARTPPQELAALGVDGGAGAVVDLADAGDRRQGLAARQFCRRRLLRADARRALLLLHRRRQGLVQRVRRRDSGAA